MKTTHIRQKLIDLGRPVESFVLGDFDALGEFTAKKSRDRSSSLYRSTGCFYRPNYERGLLINALIKHYHVRSYLEVGFGRGYSAYSAAMALEEMGGSGRVTSIDVKFDRTHLNNLQTALPSQWSERIDLIEGKSVDVVPRLADFDMIYIDGDHTYNGIKADWEVCRDKWKSVVLFDDYHLPTKVMKDIECSRLIDEINDDTKELIVMDRRIFLDDRGYTDDQIDYGQVVMTRGGVNNEHVSV